MGVIKLAIVTMRADGKRYVVNVRDIMHFNPLGSSDFKTDKEYCCMWSTVDGEKEPFKCVINCLGESKVDLKLQARSVGIKVPQNFHSFPDPNTNDEATSGDEINQVVDQKAAASVTLQSHQDLFSTFLRDVETYEKGQANSQSTRKSSRKSVNTPVNALKPPSGQSLCKRIIRGKKEAESETSDSGDSIILKSELKTLKSEVVQWRKSCDKYLERNESLLKQLKESDSKIENLEKELSEMQQTLVKKNEEIAYLTERCKTDHAQKEPSLDIMDMFKSFMAEKGFISAASSKENDCDKASEKPTRSSSKKSPKLKRGSSSHGNLEFMDESTPPKSARKSSGKKVCLGTFKPSGSPSPRRNLFPATPRQSPGAGFTMSDVSPSPQESSPKKYVNPLPSKASPKSSPIKPLVGEGPSNSPKPSQKSSEKKSKKAKEYISSPEELELARLFLEELCNKKVFPRKDNYIVINNKKTISEAVWEKLKKIPISQLSIGDQDLAVHLWGSSVLQMRSLDGLKCNRYPDRPPKPALTPAKKQIVYAYHRAKMTHENLPASYIDSCLNKDVRKNLLTKLNNSARPSKKESA